MIKSTNKFSNERLYLRLGELILKVLIILSFNEITDAFVKVKLNWFLQF